LGADIDVNNLGGSIGTPLHAAAESHNVDNAKLLVAYGAHVNERNKEGLTPLEQALRTCNNIDIEPMVNLSNLLLGAGAEKTAEMERYVAEIGRQFEFHRSGLKTETAKVIVDALNKLYEIFDVKPVPSREIHDGNMPIIVTTKTWQDQHQELWELLVPSRGATATVQGEVIRISGRISDEFYRNGGANWDEDYRRMANAFLEYIKRGEPLTTSDYL